MLIFQLQPLPIWLGLLSTVLPKIELVAMSSYLDVPVEFVLTKQQTETTTGEMKSTGAFALTGPGAVRALVRCRCSAMESVSKLASRIVWRS